MDITEMDAIEMDTRKTNTGRTKIRNKQTTNFSHPLLLSSSPSAPRRSAPLVNAFPASHIPHRFVRGQSSVHMLQKAYLKPLESPDTLPHHIASDMEQRRDILERHRDVVDYHTAVLGVHRASNPNLRQPHVTPPPLPTRPLTTARSVDSFNLATYQLYQNKPLPPIPIDKEESTASNPTMARSRIPTPIGGRGRIGGRTFGRLTAPVQPSEGEKKENVQLTQALLLDSTQSGEIPQARSLRKSRTMAFLSTIASPFSRSNGNSGSNNNNESIPLSTQPASSLRSRFGLSKTNTVANISNAAPSATANPNTTISASPAEITGSDSAVQPPPERDILDVYEAKTPPYWAGRVQALHDRYGNETIQDIWAEDPIIYFKFIVPIPTEPKPKPKNQVTSILERDLFEDEEDEENPPDDSDDRFRRAYKEMYTHCKTPEAMKSLFEFQQNHARVANKPNFLPVGGTMTVPRAKKNNSRFKMTDPKWYAEMDKDSKTRAAKMEKQAKKDARSRAQLAKLQGALL